MAALSQDSYLNKDTPFWARAGTLANSTFSTIYVADNAFINNLESFNISTVFLAVDEGVFSSISTTVLDADFANVSSISSFFADIQDIGCSSISTLGIYLDGNLLTTASGAGAELLLNGIPIATTQNISSLADWALDPAISTVRMNNNNLIDADGISGITLAVTSACVKEYLSADYISTNLLNSSTISTNYLTAYSISSLALSASSITTYNLNAVNLIAVSSYTSSISTVLMSVDDLQVSSINNSIYPPPASQLISTFQDLFTSTLAVSSINGFEFPQVISTFQDLYTSSIQTSTVVFGANTLTTNPSNQLTYNGTAVTTGDNASQWSRYAALQQVEMNAQTLNDTRTITGNGANLDVNVTGVAGSTSRMNLLAEGGNQGEINITAGSGIANNGGGLVNITALGGSPALSGLYGHINLTATYGSAGVLPTVYTGGLIELNATSGPGGGGTSAIRFSAAGINSYAGYIGTIGSVAGYNYIYGTVGVNITCDVIPSIVPNAVGTVYLFGRTGIELGSDTYANNIYPYWNLGSLPAPNLTLNGRTIGVTKSYVDLFNVSEINYDASGNSQLNGLKILNFSAVESLIQNLSSLSFVENGQIILSTLTGDPGQVVGKDASGNLRWLSGGGGPTISTFTTAQISSLTVSTILAAPGVPWIDIQANTAVNGIVSSTTLEVKASQISSINTSPADFLNVSGNLIVSNFISSLQTFTDDLRISSINNAAYPPSASPNLIVSTLTAFEYVSTPIVYTSSIIGLSSINGVSYPPAVSAGSFITLGGASVSCSALGEISAVATAGQDITLTSGSNLRLNSAGGLANAIFMNGGLTVDYTGKVLEFAPNPGTLAIEGQIVGLSTINGSVYPPPFSGSISSISNGTGFVDITPAGAIFMTATNGENTTVENIGGSFIITADDINLNGLQVGATGQDLNFPLGAGSAVVGQITNLSTINGAPWNTPGPTGPTGPTGPAGPSTSFYPYQADSGATPSSGHISWSNFASQITSTYIRVNHIDQDTVDIDIFLNLIIQGTKLILQDANVSANYQTWVVSGTPTYNTGSGYAQYPITLVASGGTSQFANNHQIILAITGTPGPTGPTGPAGPTGPTGPASVAWVAGGTYSNPNITVPAATNTLLSYQSITTFSTTSKYLIMVQFNGVETTAGNIFATIGRSSLVPTAANTTNLSDRASALTNALSGNGLHIWAESSSTSTTTIICHVVDNPGSIGTFYYSLWVLSTPGISNLATELGTVTVLQVAP